MTQPQTDPGHLVPQSDWERIVGEAESHAPSGTSAARLARGSFPSVTDFIQAKYDGGPQPGGKPTFGVLHDAEDRKSVV